MVLCRVVTERMSDSERSEGYNSNDVRLLDREAQPLRSLQNEPPLALLNGGFFDGAVKSCYRTSERRKNCKKKFRYKDFFNLMVI